MSGPQVDYVEYVEGRLAWLRRLAYLLCQDWHEADDLVQATLTRLYTYWPRAARMDNIDAYVRTILVRTFLSERRSAWFRRVLLPGSAQANGVAAARTGRRAGRAGGTGRDPAASAGHARTAVLLRLRCRTVRGRARLLGRNG